MDAPVRSRALLLPSALSAIVAGGALLVAVQPVTGPSGQPTAFAGLGSEFMLLDRLAGLGMVAAGIGAWLGSSWPRVGLLAMIAGLLWLMPDAFGGSAAALQLRDVAVLLAPFLTVVLAHLMGELRRTTIGSGGHQGPFAFLYLCTLVASAAYRLVYDHQLDATCWAVCTGSPIISLGSAPAVRAAQVAVLVVISLAAMLLALESWRWRGARATGRRGARGLLVAAGMVFATATIAAAVPTTLRYLSVRLLGIRFSAENPSIELFRLVWVLRGIAFVAIAAGLAWRVFDAWRTSARVRRIAAAFEEAPSPGSLQAALSTALGDPTLRVQYWLEHEQRYVDANGRLVDAPDEADGASFITIRRGEQRVAAVSGASGSDVPAIQRLLGAAALTALDNERLRAAVLFQIAELRASRVRIVERGDAERRRLERDLHDGAQQRLLAVSYDLRVARAAALTEGRSDTVAILDRGAAEIATTVEELRRLAHGIHPVILTEEGLGVALAAFSDETPLPLELVGFDGVPRCPAPVEAAAYQVVTEAAMDAARRGATHLRVALAVAGGRLTMDATDDAPEPPGALGRAADRVWAAGGDLLRLPSGSGAGTSIRVELPCA